MAWTDAQIADLTSMLDNALYPKNTIVTSEAMATAVFHLVDKAKGDHDELERFLQVRPGQGIEAELSKYALVICDIGHGTTDLASIAVQEFEPYVQLSEIVSGQGSLCGSEQLTNIFVGFVNDQRRQPISDLLSHHKFSKRDINIALNAKFESIRCSLDWGRARHRIAVLMEYMDKRGSKQTAELEIWLSRKEMMGIFNQWTTEVVALLRSQIRRTQAHKSEVEYIEVYLSGGGAQSKVLQEKVRNDLGSEKVKVTVPDDGHSSVVAQGSLWSLLDEETLCKPKHARVSYGMPLRVRYDPANPVHREANDRGVVVERVEGKDELVDVVVWAICKVGHCHKLEFMY